MTDIASWLADTDREIGRRAIAAGEARTAVMRRRYDAPIEDVWGACTDPDRLVRWFLPVTGDLRPGGTFQLEGNAHGDIVRCEPPRLLAVTWAYGDRAVDEVVLRLSADPDGGTLLELEHATVTEQVEWDGRMVDVIPGMGSGWEPGLVALELYLRGELPDMPAAEWIRQAPASERERFERFGEQAGQAWAELLAAARRDEGA
jgi:uncharacterized protein YndB with AHSA1/START domain